MSTLGVEGKRRGEKQRTLRDNLLISVWVTAYTGVRIAFRVVNALESLLSSKQEAVADDRDRAREKSVQGE